MNYAGLIEALNRLDSEGNTLKKVGKITQFEMNLIESERISITDFEGICQRSKLDPTEFLDIKYVSKYNKYKYDKMYFQMKDIENYLQSLIEVANDKGRRKDIIQKIDTVKKLLNEIKMTIL